MSVFDKDWFERRSDYVVKDESKSIGWDSFFMSEYSRYLYSSVKAASLCSNPELFVPEFRETMNSVNLKKDTECYLNYFDDMSFTDGKKIFVSLNCLKDNDLSNFNKIDILIGLLLHESAHCIYSDFSELVEADTAILAFQKQIQNMLEDEIIEQKLCNRWPGNSNFISAVKKRYFAPTLELIAENKAKNLLDETFSVLLLAIRYPNKLKEYVEKSENSELLEEMFKRIYEAIYRSGYLKVSSNYAVTKKTNELSAEILEIILEYIKEKSFEEQYKECQCNGEGEKSSMQKYDEACSVIESLSEISESEERKNLKEKFENIENDSSNSSLKKINRKITLSNIETKKSAFVHKANEAKYLEMLSELKKHINILKKKVLHNEKKDKLFILNNMRSGTLNTSKLAEAYQGIEHSYDKRILKKEKLDIARYALAIVIDESGSMEELKPFVERIAIIIYEAFRNEKGIELFVFGHGEEVNVYIDKTHRDRTVLAATEQQFDQNEGKSYEQILSHIHSQTKLNAVIISLTDSYYCCEPEKFKKVIEEAKNERKDSFNLIKLKYFDGYENEESEEVNKSNDELYGKGCWIEIDCKNDTGYVKSMTEIVNLLSPILAENYKKSEKLHR